jgi:hypothetical protein
MLKLKKSYKYGSLLNLVFRDNDKEYVDDDEDEELILSAGTFVSHRKEKRKHM